MYYYYSINICTILPSYSTIQYRHLPALTISSTVVVVVLSVATLNFGTDSTLACVSLKCQSYRRHFFELSVFLIALPASERLSPLLCSLSASTRLSPLCSCCCCG